MNYFKAYDQKTEFMIWGICINKEHIDHLKSGPYITIPIKKEMFGCKEIKLIYHKTEKETVEFIKKLSNENTEEHFLDE